MTDSVRPMQPEDVGVALEIVAASNPSLVSWAHEAIARGISEQPNRFYVCERDGVVVGCLGWEYDHFGVPDIRWLVWGYVRPDVQRGGIGALLFDYVESLLAEAGCRKAYLDVGNPDGHVSAIAFHEKRHYIREGYLSDYWSRGEDFLIYGKVLGRANV